MSIIDQFTGTKEDRNKKINKIVLELAKIAQIQANNKQQVKDADGNIVDQEVNLNKDKAFHNAIIEYQKNAPHPLSDSIVVPLENLDNKNEWIKLVHEQIKKEQESKITVNVGSELPTEQIHDTIKDCLKKTPESKAEDIVRKL